MIDRAYVTHSSHRLLFLTQLRDLPSATRGNPSGHCFAPLHDCWRFWIPCFCKGFQRKCEIHHFKDIYVRAPLQTISWSRSVVDAYACQAMCKTMYAAVTAHPVSANNCKLCTPAFRTSSSAWKKLPVGGREGAVLGQNLNDTQNLILFE